MKSKEEVVIEQDIKDDFSDPADGVFDKEPRKPRFVELKVTGMIIGLILLIAAAAFVVTNLPPVKYKLSEHYASQGMYLEARDKLHDILNYKDSERKYDEYGLIICKHYLAKGAADEALKWAEWTSGSHFEDISKEANNLISEIKQQKNAAAKPENSVIQSAK